MRLSPQNIENLFKTCLVDKDDPEAIFIRGIVCDTYLSRKLLDQY